MKPDPQTRTLVVTLEFPFTINLGADRQNTWVTAELDAVTEAIAQVAKLGNVSSITTQVKGTETLDGSTGG